MLKITILYGHPASPEYFEKYYAETHMPLAEKMLEVERFELTKFTAGPDGGKPAYYRMAELYFTTPEEMQRTLDSPEGQAAVSDLSNFASGGVTILVGAVEE